MFRKELDFDWREVQREMEPNSHSPGMTNLTRSHDPRYTHELSPRGVIEGRRGSQMKFATEGEASASLDTMLVVPGVWGT
jgi:hypothetical protein